MSQNCFFFSTEKAQGRNSRGMNQQGLGKGIRLIIWVRGGQRVAVHILRMSVAHKTQYNKAPRVTLNFKHVAHSVSCLITLMNTNGLLNTSTLEATLPAEQTPLHSEVGVNQHFQEVLQQTIQTLSRDTRTLYEKFCASFVIFAVKLPAWKPCFENKGRGRTLLRRFCT